jgi:hypothetical protein
MADAAGARQAAIRGIDFSLSPLPLSNEKTTTIHLLAERAERERRGCKTSLYH